MGNFFNDRYTFNMITCEDSFIGWPFGNQSPTDEPGAQDASISSSSNSKLGSCPEPVSSSDSSSLVSSSLGCSSTSEQWEGSLQKSSCKSMLLSLLLLMSHMILEQPERPHCCNKAASATSWSMSVSRVCTSTVRFTSVSGQFASRACAWASLRQQCVTAANTTILPQYSRNVVVVLLQYCCGAAAVLLLYCCSTAAVVLWYVPLQYLRGAHYNIVINFLLILYVIYSIIYHIVYRIWYIVLKNIVYTTEYIYMWYIVNMN